MEIGLWKMKKHQSIVARPSPALGVLFWVVFCNASVLIDVIVYNSLMYSCFFASEFAASEHSGQTAMVLRYHQRECVCLSFLSNLLWLDSNGAPWSP